MRVRARYDATDKIAVFDLEPTNAGFVGDLSAGSHIDVRLGDEGIVRQYSLCGPVGRPDFYRIAVLRVDPSRGGSRAMHDLKVGDELEISTPRQNFGLVDARHHILIAGGIGVTPLIAMARSLDFSGGDYRLHYVARSRDAAVFIPELDRNPRVTFHFTGPKSTVVLYDPENPRVAAVAAKVWVVPVAGETRHRVNLYYADAVYKFISATQRLPMTVQAADFVPYVDADTDEAGYTQNPYGQIPIFHVATDRPFGTPEHKAAYGPQDIINKLVITQMASVEHYGFPTRYVLSENHANVANDFDDDDDSADLSGNPGDLWMLTNTKQVGQFDAAKPDTYLAPYKEYIRTMASVTSTPLHYFENTQTNVSGEALRASEAALIKKVRDRQLSFGTAIRSMFVFILKLYGITSDVQLHWAQPESIDDKERWEVAYKKVQAGLPVKQMLIEQGYDTQIVESWDLPVLNPQTSQLEQNTENEGETAA